MNRSLVIGVSPNTKTEDVMQAIRLLVTPWRFFSGESLVQLERWFRNFFDVSYAISFVSGRAAMYSLLHCMDIAKGDEVIMQAFTCTVVADAIIATGATPVYADITGHLTLDPKDVEKKITKKTKAIIIQHTFGIPADMEELLKVAKKYKLQVIEDVAHTIGGMYKKKKLGTFGDAAFFSFGRDKAFSSVWGGMAITNNKNLGQTLRVYQRQREMPSLFFVYQQLFHPIICSIVLSTYDFFALGKVIMVVAQKLGLVSFPVSSSEKNGIFQPSQVKKLPHALACLALRQIKKLDEYNQKRQEFGRIYQEKLHTAITRISSENTNFLRFPILVEDPISLVTAIRRTSHIYLGNWYSNVMDPKGSNFTRIFYTKGSCPVAEHIAQKMVNLPTMPTMESKEVERILDAVNTYVANQTNNK